MSAVQVTIDDKILNDLIKAAGGTKTYVIHDGVEYGVFVEFGTSRKSARPSARKAWEKHTQELPQIIGEAVKNAAPIDDVIGKVAFDIQADWAADVPVDTGAYKNSITVDVE